nr:putative DNA-binding protein [Mycolicibacter nonchromogenicus]
MIAKLDSGHRGSVLSVAELIVLAYALDVPPGALLYPDLPDGTVEVLPNWRLPSWVALLSLDGETKGVRSIGGVPELTPLAAMVRRRHELKQERKAMWALHARELAAAKAEGREPVQGALESALQQVARTDRDIAELNQRMAAIGGVGSEGGGDA